MASSKGTAGKLGAVFKDNKLIRDLYFDAIRMPYELFQIARSEGLRIQLQQDSTGVCFKSGSSTPQPTGTELLQLLEKTLGGLPNAVVIAGHTDSRPYTWPDGYSNWERSVDRAKAARRIIQGGGLYGAQVQLVPGEADRRTRDPEHPMADATRRVTVTMLLPTHPDALPDSLARRPDWAEAVTTGEGAASAPGDSAHVAVTTP